MVREFESEDEGKRVVNSGGEMIGVIESASGSTAQVKPEETLSRSIRRRLGWTDESEEHYELQHSRVDSITDEEVHLKE